LLRIRHTADTGAQASQLPLGASNRPHRPSQSQPAPAYSSGQPKMCPDSCAKTRSRLSGPHPSLSYDITSRGPPTAAYAKTASGYLVKNAQ
jgi:hypothetical protein